MIYDSAVTDWGKQDRKKVKTHDSTNHHSPKDITTFQRGRSGANRAKPNKRLLLVQRYCFTDHSCGTNYPSTATRQSGFVANHITRNTRQNYPDSTSTARDLGLNRHQGYSSPTATRKSRPHVPTRHSSSLLSSFLSATIILP